MQENVTKQKRDPGQCQACLLPSIHLSRCRFLPCDVMHKRGYCRHAVSVCPSVRLSRSWVAPKRIKISLNFFHHRVAKPFWFFRTKQGGAIPTGTPLTGASNARGVWKNDDFRPLSRSIWETVIVRWAHAAARQFVSIEFSSIHTRFSVIALWASPGGTKMW